MADQEDALLTSLRQVEATEQRLSAFLERNKSTLRTLWVGRADEGQWEQRAAALRVRFPKLTWIALRQAWWRARRADSQDKQAPRQGSSFEGYPKGKFNMMKGPK